MADGLKFGTSGLRGLATELAGSISARYAGAFLAHLRESRQIGDADAVLVGLDLRESSPAVASWVMAGVAAAGLRPLDCGHLPTPALALEALRLGSPAIMVTGSHIPAVRNGLKFYTGRGEITKEDEQGILESLESVAELSSSDVQGEAAPEVLSRYLERCRLLLPPGALAGKRIGVWQHSSVFRDELLELLASFGAEPVPLGWESGFKAVDTEAIAVEDAAQIASWVRAHRLDALVSTDGDADRPLVADDTGSIIRGDLLGMFTGRYLNVRAVATPVTSTSVVETSGFFDRVIRTRVGSPYVLAGMADAQLGAEAVIGFEANGGVLLGTPVRLDDQEIAALPTRDAMLPILSILGLARETGHTLSELIATLPPRFARSGRLEHIPAERSQALMARLSDDYFADLGDVEAVDDLDGVRVSFTSGDVMHYRPSGNAPELRCYVEASTPERADWLLNWGLSAAERVVR